MLKYKKQFAQLYRAFCCTRLTTFITVVYEASKILVAVSLFALAWQQRKPPVPPLIDIASSSSSSSSHRDSSSVVILKKSQNRQNVPWIPVIETNSASFLAGENIELAAASSEKRPRIFCLCSTTGPRHQERAIHARSTWGKRCDELLFASDVDDAMLPSKAFFNETGRKFVTFKMFAAWQYVHDNFLEKFDWFVKADDDTFVVMENMRLFLSKYSYDEPYYFGRPLSTNRSKFYTHYVSGAAYVLSKVALSRLVKESFPEKDKCPGPRENANEDAYIGYCLHSIGIPASETRDETMRNRFLIFSAWINLHFGTSAPNIWIWTYDKTYVEGEQCCSNHAVSLHYMPAGKMVMAEYLIYRLRPIGVGNSVVVRPCR